MGSDAKADGKEFVGWRSIFWPIHSYELKKFLPMAFIMMCILFNYSVLRGLKDAMVVTNMGAEAIPTLKLWFVLPSAILFMITYSKLSNIFSKNTVFYIIVGFFAVYFSLFATIFYPFHESLVLSFSGISNEFLNKLLLPISGWPFSSFYVIAELWGSAMVSLMFWRFANDVTSLKQSKRFYAMFGFVANGALIVSGNTLKAIKSTSLICWIAVAICMIIISIYYWLNNYVLTDPRFFNPDDIKKPKKKEKLSLGDSMKYILGSKYLGFIVLLIVCYGISINLVEVMWKGQVRLLCPTEAEFSAFMGRLQIWTGVGSIICMLIGANVLRRCSWFTGAMATPIMIFVTGLIFFGCIVFKDTFTPLIESFGGLSVLSVIAFIGLLQNVLSKGVKYSLFDPTKEMSYIPLDEELKSKGKAAAEVIGGRAGKSGGAAIQFLLLNVIFVGSSLVELAPIIAVIFAVILMLWFYAVSGLNKQFLKVSAEHNKK